MNWKALRERLVGEDAKDVKPPKLSIPALPAVAMEFCQAADRLDATIVELAAILERDATLVLDLLKTVNSSSTGLRTKVNSARTALSLLGPRRAKMFVLTSSVQNVASKIKSPLANANCFSFAAMQRAVFARRLADRLGHDGDLAFAGALLQDFTTPALTAERPEKYRSFLSVLAEEVSSIVVLEKARFGWDHAVAGARLMLSWEFPDDLICLTFAHHWLDPILGSPAFADSELLDVALSALLPDPLDSRPARTQRLEHHLATRVGLDVAEFHAAVQDDLQNCGVAMDSNLAWTPAAVEQPALA